MLTMQQHGVLRQRAQSRACRQLTLQDGARVDVGTRAGTGKRVLDPGSQLAQPLPHHIVVVPPPRVAGDPRPQVTFGLVFINQRRVLKRDAKGTTRTRQELRGVLSLRHPSLDPCHVGMVAAREPGA